MNNEAESRTQHLHRPSIRGPVKTAAQAAPKFKKTLLREENAYVRTVDECKKVAQAKLDRLALNYVSGSGLCLGLPELIPGRFITIEGLDGDTVRLLFHHQGPPPVWLRLSASLQK